MLNTNTRAFKREDWSFHLWWEAIMAWITGNLMDSVGCCVCPTQDWSHIQINLMARVIESTALCGTQVWDINKWLRPQCPSWYRWNAHQIKIHSWVNINIWAFGGPPSSHCHKFGELANILSTTKNMWRLLLNPHWFHSYLSVGRREKEEGRRNSKYGLLCSVYLTLLEVFLKG